jgi:PAS domain S-box-containing protein
MAAQRESPLSNQVAEDLQQSEARFRAVFENAAVGIEILGFDRRLIDANPALCRMLDKAQEEIIGRSQITLLHPDDIPQSTNDFQKLVSGETDCYEAERRYLRKNGEVFWAHVTMNLVRGREGLPLYIIGMVMDIDDRKRTQIELRQSEERFRATFESSAIGMGLLALDGKILKVNEAVCRISGYSRDELQQRYDHQNIYPDDREIDRVLFAELLAGLRDSYEVEKRYIRKNGGIFWTRLTLSAVRNPDNSVAYLVGMLEDIDAQKRLLVELRESEARFRAIFENVAVGIAIMSLDRRPLEINSVTEQIIGYNMDELRGVDARTLALPEDRAIDGDLFEELVDGRRNSYVMERRYRRKDGRVIWARINYSLVRDVNGEPRYLVGMIEDIDEQKRAAERLAGQEAEYRRMLERKVEERTRALQEINQHLEEEILQRRKAEQALAEKAAQDAIASERTRLARDLHDAVTQTLFSASLIAEVLPDLWEINPPEGERRLEELRQLTRGALAEMRTLLVELRPNSLVQIPLPDLLRQLCESLIGRARLPIELVVDGQSGIPPDVQIALYRITQEALNNIVKHAKATKAVVTLHLGAPLRLVVIDDGSGFDLSSVSPDHLGLKIMYERAESVGASCSINSRPGEGTQVSVVWQAPEQNKG